MSQSARMDMRTGGAAILRPDETRGAGTSGAGPHGLPTDLVRQATRRLRVLALLYAAVFFLVAFFPLLISRADRSVLFGAVAQWLPRTIAISVADRPQTARELARRLEAVPVSCEWTPEAARAWWETHQPVARA
jgi:hypothetical protein